MWVAEQIQVSFACLCYQPHLFQPPGIAAHLLQTHQECNHWQPYFAIMHFPVPSIGWHISLHLQSNIYPSTHLHFFFILESPFAHDDVFNTPPITKLLLKDGIIFKEFLGLLFWNSIQGILVDHSYSFKLKADRMIICHSTTFTFYSWLAK